jgi:hypothetical protein
LAWATAQPRIVGAIVGDAADHGALTGLRAATGGWRPAAGVLLRTARMLREVKAAPPSAPADTTTAGPDSTAVPADTGKGGG